MGAQELCKEIMLKKEKKKRIWVSDWIRRKELGASSRLLKELADEDPSFYMNVLSLAFQNSRTKLEIALRYLATGDSFKSLMCIFRVPHNTISSFLPKVLLLSMKYQRLPSLGNRFKLLLRANEIFPTAVVPSTGNISLFNVQQTVLLYSTTIREPIALFYLQS
nr:unnamed protein product [Callosobruchus analis]